MSRKYHVQERAFLNKKTGLRAYVIGIVEDTRDIADSFEDGWKYPEIELRLADCYEEISFEFNLSTPEERANSLYKIRKLAEVIGMVREAIEIECESSEAREAVKPLLRALSAVH